MSVSYKFPSVDAILSTGRNPLADNIMKPGRYVNCMLETVTATTSDAGSPILRLMFSRVNETGQKEVVFASLGYVPCFETERKTGNKRFVFTPTALVRFIKASPQLVRALPMPSIEEFTADLADVDPADQEAWTHKFNSDLAQSRLAFFSSLVGSTCSIVVNDAPWIDKFGANRTGTEVFLTSYAVASNPTA